MTVVAVHAAEPQAAPELAATAQPQVVPTTLIGESVLSTLGSDCGADADQALAIGLPDATNTATGFCGQCSTSQCAGLERGQRCYISGVGFGNCNIYSGGYRCSTGGWECQCGIGPLP